MALFDTPFTDNCGVKSLPLAGTGNVSKEPFNGGQPAKTGGFAPETLYDTNTVPKSPGWISPDKTDFFWGT